MDCQICARRSDWDFLKEFFNREELAKQHIQNLNGHVAQLSAALQHSGQTTQRDRVALNKSNDHMQQLQNGFNQSEAARARLEIEIHQERQEHRMCQEVLDRERNRHSSTERSLDQMSASYQRLVDITSKVKWYTDDNAAGDAYMGYNVTDLVHELLDKSHRIFNLESQLAQHGEQHRREVAQIKEKLEFESAQHVEEYVGQANRIEELEVALQQEQKRQDTTTKVPTLSEVPKAIKKRRGGRGRSGAMGDSGHEGPATLEPADQEAVPQGDEKLPHIKGEPL